MGKMNLDIARKELTPGRTVGDAHGDCTGALSRRRRGALNRERRSGGFTLIEAALTVVIISTGVLAIMSAQQAFHKKNDWAQRSGTALLLANELRELTKTLPKHDPFTNTETLGPEPNENGVADFDDVDDFAGVVTAGVGAGTTFNPPINALRQEIPDMERWTQQVTVANVLQDNISSTFTQPIGTTDLMRVTVTVLYESPTDTNQGHGPSPVTTLSWIITE